jgi:predicted DNA-binding transcriptional regulator YafY
MRADRLISLVLLLQTRGRMTAQELAGRLEVSERTIYRDLDALSAAGIPVYGEHGPGGGYALIDSYRTTLTGLTADQVRALLVSGTSSPLADLGLANDMEAALLKLLAALPSAQREGAEHMRQRVYLDPSWWFQSSESVPHLPTLQHAIWHNLRLHITYHRSAGGLGDRVIEPYGLVAKASVWYLVASIGEEMRVYRVSRIRTVQVLEERFERPGDFDLAAYWNTWSHEFETTRPRYEVRLRISPNLVDFLPQIWGEGIRERIAQADPPDAQGWITIPVFFDSPEFARASILSLGAQVEVIEPPELREELVRLAEEVMQQYHPDSIIREKSPSPSG